MNRFILCLCVLAAAGCARNSTETWEDLKTAGRYMGRGIDAMWGKDYDSRMLTSDEEFVGPFDDEFVPLRDADLKNIYAMSDSPMPQPKGIPGQKGIPPLSDFYIPPDALMAVFRTSHFDTDDHVVRDKGEVHSLMQMAAYLKQHPNVYLLIEGNCDERQTASYNLALGMRRANYVRSFLVKHGADLNRIYTVSRGKERPVALGHTPEDWKANRRAEFKLYQK